jgi:inhibitor of cysteine peptidase
VIADLLLATLQLVSPVFSSPSVVAEVKTGDDFVIALPSNVTTGYAWTQKIADGSVVAYEGNVYQNPAAERERPGAGGQQLFIFHANATGTTQIAFAYARPFESTAPPAKSVSFTVTVH